MEDGEATLCMYAALNMGWRPKKFLSLPRREKALVIASIMRKAEIEDELRRKYGH